MRSSVQLAAAALAALIAGCADAPITPAHLEENGELRADLQQSLFKTPERAQERQTARSLQLTGVLAGEAEGALEDRTVFDAGPTVFLHLRADRLEEPRPVRYVWSRGEQREETMGFLMPSPTLALAASRRFADEDAGRWRVEVWALSPFGTDPLVFEREFDVVAGSG